MIKMTLCGLVAATSLTLTGCLYDDTYTPYTSDVAVSVSSYPVDYAYYYDPVYYPVFYSSYYQPYFKSYGNYYRHMSIRTRPYRHYGVTRHHQFVTHGTVRRGHVGARRGGGRR